MSQLFPEQQFPVFSAKKSWSPFMGKIWNLMAPWSFWLCEVRLVGLLFTGLPVCLPEGRILTLRCSFPFCGASTPSAGVSHWSLAAQSAKHETLRHWWYISLVLQPRNKRHGVREEMERRGEWVRERDQNCDFSFLCNFYLFAKPLDCMVFWTDHQKASNRQLNNGGCCFQMQSLCYLTKVSCEEKQALRK